MNAIEIKNMSKTYSGGIRALENVSFNVPEGHIFGLLGPKWKAKNLICVFRKRADRVGISIWKFNHGKNHSFR